MGVCNVGIIISHLRPGKPVHLGMVLGLECARQVPKTPAQGKLVKKAETPVVVFTQTTIIGGNERGEIGVPFGVLSFADIYIRIDTNRHSRIILLEFKS